jgi:L-ribulose-5-phosphate 3-epimerase
MDNKLGNFDRRWWLKAGTAAAASIGLGRGRASVLAAEPKQPLFKISLAEWSFHKALHGGKMDHLDFPKVAKELGIDAVEYVNQFFMDKAKDDKYLAELKKRCEDQGVESVLIMCDNEGHLGDPDDQKRKQAVENHRKWIHAAQSLGCHSIRVNAHSEGGREEQARLAADGLRQLSEIGAPEGIAVIVENHGGLSSDGQWLADVIEAVGMDNCGTLPDFGNFQDYDRYKGVKELMPYAKGVSAKSHQFDQQGNEVHTDYRRMMRIVLDAGYHGHVGIEWEGDKPADEREGVLLTKRLLERVREELTKTA